MAKQVELTTEQRVGDWVHNVVSSAYMSDWGARVRTARALRDAAEHDLREEVAFLRTNGKSWTEIAGYLGVSRQAARQKYGEFETTRSNQAGDLPPALDGL